MKIKKFNKLLSYIDKLSEVEKQYLKFILDNNNSTNKIPIRDNVINIGDEISINHSRYGDIPFIVIGKNHNASNSVTLLTRYIVRLLAFDAKEANNCDSQRQGLGDNRYKCSNILQWMNSDKAAGEWYTPRYKYDAPPNGDNVTYNPYTNIDGLLRGFDNDIVNSMITVQMCSDSDIIYSRVFLLSATEVGLANDSNITEGKIYEYFNNNPISRRLAYPSKYCLNNAGGFADIEFSFWEPWKWLLRTHSSSNSGTVHVVTTHGTLDVSCACSGINGLRFAICLPTDKYLELKEKEIRKND